MSALALNKYEDLLIVGGSAADYPHYKDRVETIVDNANAYIDSSYTMFQYSIEVYGPTMIIRNGESSSYINIYYKNLSSVLEIIGWKDPKKK